MPSKKIQVLLALLMGVVMAGCSGVKGGSGGFSGGGTGSGSSGSGSSGSGSGSGGGTGTTSGPFSISGTIVGLTGSGLTIQDNGGDNQTAKSTGSAIPFTFATSIPSGGKYSVTVLTQPTNPAQSCSVNNGSGTASANVTNVQVVCAATFTVGGTISGLDGSGMVLQDNSGDNLTVTGTGNVNFTFATPLLSGAAYAVTILTQPSNPVQTCFVTNGSGTIVGSINTVQISCSQPKFQVGGVVVGLITGPGDTLELQDNAGDDLFVTGDTSFTFPNPYTYGSTFRVDLFLPPTSQPQGCTVFNSTALVTGIVSNVIVDCQHNDWAWMFPGPTTTPSINQYGTADLPPWSVASPIPTPPFASANNSNPGGRDYAMTWTDLSGNRWMFGGFGFEVTHTPVDNIPGFLNDMWVWPTSGDQDGGWWLPGGWVPANLEILFNGSSTPGFYYADPTPLEFKNRVGQYGTKGSGVACNNVLFTACTTPGARWGGATWTDASGNLWLFGGQGLDSVGDYGVLNDVWEFNMSSCGWDYTTGTQIFTGCQWVWQNGSSLVNQATTATFPGARWGSAYYTDASGNLWMFGGQGYDSAGNIGLLNDLWKYNIGTQVWTLVSGSTTANQDGVYGTQGTAAAANVPGGRQNHVLWTDSSGNIWTFGGFGLDSVGTNLGTGEIGSALNDLWEYNPTSQQWTWISGSNTANQNGVYGTQTVEAAGDFPGSRWGSVGWIDAANNLWIFGGFGYGTNNTKPTGFLNDIWQYDPVKGQWLWWKGSTDVNQPGTYITAPFDYFQLSYVNNAVGARRGAARWLPDPQGYVYMFGGEGYDSTAGGPYGDLNDTWHYLPFP
jgi:N-acetylneuraminic acid mutarotase